MNRPVKFRIWDGREMVQPVHLPIIDSGMPRMQFTGLVDRNGIEIYEGDLISIDDAWREMIGGDLPICQVGFHNGAFMFGRHSSGPCHMDSYLWMTCAHCVVVGNLFQTPVVVIPEKQGLPA